MSDREEVRRLTDLVRQYLPNLQQAVIEDRWETCDLIRSLMVDTDKWTGWNSALQAVVEAVQGRENPRRFSTD